MKMIEYGRWINRIWYDSEQIEQAKRDIAQKLTFDQLSDASFIPSSRLSDILRAEREGRCVVLAPGYTKCMVCKQSRNGWCENKENDGHCLFVVFNPKPTRAEAEAELSGEGAGS
jgi:hypothetical protein